MAAVISKHHDAMILQGLQGVSKGDQTTFLNAVKTLLDAEYSQFRTNGQYTTANVQTAMNRVMNKGK